MSFITKSVNYSETENFKCKFLKNICENINSTIRNLTITESNFYKNRTETGEPDDEIYIANNNKKYYACMVKKSLISNSDNNWNIIYFFPDKNTTDVFKNDKLNKNIISDFFIETEFNFPNILSCLFEGYLYKKTDDNLHFLITDILYINTENNDKLSILQMDYMSRFLLINELFLKNNIKNMCVKNINNHIDIGIHQVFSKSKRNMLTIFKNNFIYKNQLCCIETINKNNFVKTTYIEPNQKHQDKWIEKDSKYADVYKVFNLKTMNQDGILYVKGILESKKLKNLFIKSDNQEKIQLKCKWNTDFNKWQPIFE